MNVLSISNTVIGHWNYVGIQHKHALVDDIPLTHDDNVRKAAKAVIKAITSQWLGRHIHFTTSPQRNLEERAFQPYFQGSECCSELSVTLHRMETGYMLVFFHLLYKTHVYGRNMAASYTKFYSCNNRRHVPKVQRHVHVVVQRWLHTNRWDWLSDVRMRGFRAV
ncbi:hypothetical protein DPMN_033371 [Dreissena polymorpha]|uniref:Uncharacterized protein n=1 Tax=Dreissena polymorpha TaxID=45954 RepID=A0A9D4M6H8_DREPO|nr:hypothetical protein DPMN_033371 [Dreissena polymorpha]